MAFFDISEEEVTLITSAIKEANDCGTLSDEYTAFNMLQRFKKEFPQLEYMFDFLDYDFCHDDEDNYYDD